MNQKNQGLHLDVRLGATAEVIIGALIELFQNDITPIKNGLSACDISTIVPHLSQRKSKSLSGSFLKFFDSNGQSIVKDVERNSNFSNTKTLSVSAKPVWAMKKKSANLKIENYDQDLAQSQPVDGKRSITDDMIGSWLRGSDTSIDVLRGVFQKSRLPAIPKALAIRIIDAMISEKEPNSFSLNGKLAVQFLCEILSLVQMLDSISPSFVSATHVAMSTPPFIYQSENSLHLSDWLLFLTIEIPVIERKWPAPHSDIIGLAFLRAIVSRYGARGESLLLRYGTGLQSSNADPMLCAHALLCAPVQIASLPYTTNQDAGSAPLCEITATLGPGIDVADLMNRLKNLGMKSIHTWQTFESSTHPRLLLRGILPHANLPKASHAVLVTGEATEVYTRTVEEQSLQERTVAVAYGSEQKRQICKVTEFLLAGQIVRVEPDNHDLIRLSKITGHPREILRADILAAWKQMQIS